MVAAMQSTTEIRTVTETQWTWRVCGAAMQSATEIRTATETQWALHVTGSTGD